MKQLLTILFFVLSLPGFAQSKKVINALSNSRTFERAVFETRDSAVLEGLFAKTLSYTDVDGKVRSREEAISGILNDRSVYSPENSLSASNVMENNDSMIVKHIYNTFQKRTDGSQYNLKLSIETVWAKENGKWKLFRSLIAKL